MTTTLSQYIRPNENLSISFLSTPDFKNDAPSQSKNRQSIMLENFKDGEIQNQLLKLQESRVKPWSEQQPVRDSNLFFKIHEVKCQQKGHLNYQTFGVTQSQRADQQSDYTPESLLEKLRNFKQNQENYSVKDEQNKPFQFTSKSKFSLIALKNPAFRQIEQFKRRRWERLTRSGLGWYDKSLYEIQPPASFYRIPDQDDVVVVDYIEDQQEILDRKQESNEKEEKIKTQNEKQDNLFSSNLQKKNQDNNLSYSLLIIRLLLQQPNLIQNSQVRKKTLQQIAKFYSKSREKSQKIDVQIQTEMKFKQLKELSNQDLNKLTFEQLSDEIIKHLKVIEAINNSYYSEIIDGNEKLSTKKQKFMVDSEKYQMAQSKDQQKIKKFDNKYQLDSQMQIDQQQKFDLGESKYLKSSHSHFEITPSQKQQLLQKFNKQQKQMINQLFQSMISISSESLQNSMILNPERRIIKTQARIFKSQLCYSPANSFDMEKIANKNQVKQSEINFHPPKDSQIRQMTFLKKTYQDIISLDPSKIMNTSTQEKKLYKKLNEGQFQKLEQLMRDREMKKSILGSNVADSSFNSESFLQIIDSQTAEKFKKFNPDTFKKDEQIINQ